MGEQTWRRFARFAESVVAMYHAQGVTLLDVTSTRDWYDLETESVDEPPPCADPVPWTAEQVEGKIRSVIEWARSDGTEPRQMLDVLGKLATELYPEAKEGG